MAGVKLDKDENRCIVTVTVFYLYMYHTGLSCWGV